MSDAPLSAERPKQRNVLVPSKSLRKMAREWLDDPACVDGETDAACDGVQECVNDLLVFLADEEERRYIPRDQRVFQMSFTFLGWNFWSLGVHIDPMGPHVDVHVPGGWFRLGFVRSGSAEPRCFGIR